MVMRHHVDASGWSRGVRDRGALRIPLASNEGVRWRFDLAADDVTRRILYYGGTPIRWRERIMPTVQTQLQVAVRRCFVTALLLWNRTL